MSEKNITGETQMQWARRIADTVATFLQQECKLVDGAWWLFSLGSARRVLTDDEVEHAKGRGLIP